MNPFNDTLSTYLRTEFNFNLNLGYDSIWLDSNVPYVSGTDQTDSKETNPFYQLPFIPGELPLSSGNLPEFAKYATTNGSMDYHFNLLGRYGH